MKTTLDKLLADHREYPVDGTIRDVVRQTPSDRTAPLRQTLNRVEVCLATLAGTIRENKSEFPVDFQASGAAGRQGEGYSVAELQTNTGTTEDQLKLLVFQESTDPVHHNTYQALLDAIPGAARMVLSMTNELRGGPEPTLEVQLGFPPVVFVGGGVCTAEIY